MKKCNKCKTKIDDRSTYCRQCNGINRRKPKNYCCDCKKEIYRQDAKRCKSCARVHQYATRPETNPMFGKVGKLHPRFNGGEEVRKRFCIDCHEELNHTACYDNNKRCKSCARKEEYKDPTNHPQWLNGLSYEPYSREFTESLKASIRDRDNHKCQHCGKSEAEELKELNKVLSIHHINYNKKDCIDTNLITLCSRCNTLANANRDYWFAYFTEILNCLLVT